MKDNKKSALPIYVYSSHRRLTTKYAILSADASRCFAANGHSLTPI